MDSITYIDQSGNVVEVRFEYVYDSDEGYMYITSHEYINDKKISEKNFPDTGSAMEYYGIEEE